MSHLWQPLWNLRRFAPLAVRLAELMPSGFHMSESSKKGRLYEQRSAAGDPQ